MLRPSGGMASVPDVYEVDQVEPGYPLDCGSSEGPGYWGARYTLRNLSRPESPLGPLTVPAAQLVLVDDVPALPADEVVTA
ncbi:hypothetical protein AB0A63_31670 [Lentzea sp. NPDC042327]|uniref:hypothetical protein n=1 Tax=Lentzea sp. NPDC042327 TaxID=3154801 RepID=UPI0033D88086